MTIRVTNDGFSKDGIAKMCFTIERCSRVSALNEVYFLTVLKGLKDTDKRAFLGAMDTFIKTELEQLNDKE